jgi:hypothetical protein
MVVQDLVINGLVLPPRSALKREPAGSKEEMNGRNYHRLPFRSALKRIPAGDKEEKMPWRSYIIDPAT